MRFVPWVSLIHGLGMGNTKQFTYTAGGNICTREFTGGIEEHERKQREKQHKQRRNKGEEEMSRPRGSKATVRQSFVQSQLAITKACENEEPKKARG